MLRLVLRTSLIAMLTLPSACSEDDSDDAANSSAGTVDDGGTSTGGDDGDASGGSGDDGGADGSDTADPGGTDSAGGMCVPAGEPCAEGDYCNSWGCVCLNSTTEFMTIGSCVDGVCLSDGEIVCRTICMPNGGVMEATDLGCG